MSVTITPVYAGLAAIVFVILSLRVISERNRAGEAWGIPPGSRLQRLARAHGNFAEYAPFGLVLLFLAEFQGAPAWLVHLAGSCLIAGRVVHAYGLSERPAVLGLRVSGMVLTFTALGLGAAGALIPAL